MRSRSLGPSGPWSRRLPAMSILAVSVLAVCLLGGAARAGPTPAPPKPAGPVVQLLVGGVVHEPGAALVVAADGPTRIRARLMDSHRFIALNPAHLQQGSGGKVRVVRSGDWGYAYTAGGGSTELALSSERAEFVPGAGLGLKRLGETEAEVRLVDPARPASLQVEVTLGWRLTITPPNKPPLPPRPVSVKATGSFQLLAPGVKPATAWFTSKYLRATGQESFTVGRILAGLQAELDALGVQLASRQAHEDGLRAVSLAVGRLKARLADLEAALARDRAATPPVVSEVTLTGLPTDEVSRLLEQHQRRADALTRLWTYCQGRKAEATAQLYQARQHFAGNVVRSIFKNYLSWLNGFFSAADLLSVPTSLPDLLPLLTSSRVASALDKPRGLLEAWTAAINDSSILLTQQRAIRLFSEAEQFFQERMTAAAGERAELYEGLHRMEPAVKRVETELRAVVAGLKLTRFSER